MTTEVRNRAEGGQQELAGKRLIGDLSRLPANPAELACSDRGRCDLRTFTFAEMVDVGATLRRVAQGTASLESAAQHIARFFYDGFVDPATQRSGFVLARCFKTFALGELPADLQAVARSGSSRPTSTATRSRSLPMASASIAGPARRPSTVARASRPTPTLLFTPTT